MRVRSAVLALVLVLGLSGCTVYEGYVVTETRTKPERPVEVAREGGISDFDEVLVAGADLAAAIIAPVAAVAKAVVISAVDVEVNRSKETRTMKFSRWFSTDASAFPNASARAEEAFGKTGIEVERDATAPDMEGQEEAEPQPPEEALLPKEDTDE